VLPGNIFEETLEISSLYSENLIVRIEILCDNKELDDHDEYVFSARKLSGYDYNDKF
jgi:hypothetical protein